MAIQAGLSGGSDVVLVRNVGLSASTIIGATATAAAVVTTPTTGQIWPRGNPPSGGG